MTHYLFLFVTNILDVFLFRRAVNTGRHFSDGSIGVHFVEFFVVPFSLSVARQPDGANAFPHVNRDRLAGVELNTSAVASNSTGDSARNLPAM